MTAEPRTRTPLRRPPTQTLLRAFEHYFVPDELLADGTTDAAVVRRRYRRMVRSVAGISVALLILTLWPAGVPVGDWPVYAAATAGTAAVISAVLNLVPPGSRLAIPGSIAMAATIVALDRLIGGYYHEAPLLFALVVAGSAIIQGVPAAFVLVLAGAVFAPRSSPTALDAPVAVVDHVFAFLYLLGVAAIVWTYRRLSERSAAAVAASREEFRDLVERVPAVVYSAESRTPLQWHYVSPRVSELLGEAQSVVADADAWQRHIHPDDAEARRAVCFAAAQVGRIDTEYRMVASDSSVRWVRDEAELVAGPDGEHWSGLLHDITDRRELESQLRQSQRLEVVGRLAGGVAHDFNNLLTAIRGYGEFVLGTLPDPAPARDDMVELLAAADRAAGLTRQLLAFSRRQSLRPEVLDPGGAIECMVPMLRRLLGEHIEVTLLRPAEPCHIRMDLSALEQVVLNLAVNAGAAMPDGGRFELAVSVTAIGPEDAIAPDIEGPHPAGRYVRLTFSDTGSGMDAETVAHAFEPFFTTKRLGEGTGLGLATVYGIVTQSNGRVRCRSEVGSGTDFTVVLPWVAAPQPTPADVPFEPDTGRESILVVEDEAAVRELTCRQLTNLGYRVRAAASGHEAMDLLERGGEPDLMLTDVRMPGMQGPELARRVHDRWPAIRILMMSGFAERGPGPASRGGPRLLPKPFDSAALAAAVRAALDTTA